MLNLALSPDGADLVHVRSIAREWARENAVPDWPLTLILTELVANAIAVTPPGGTIGVALATHDGAVEIEVSDGGPGFEGRRMLLENPELPPLEQHGGRGLYLVRQLTESLTVAREAGRTVVRACARSVQPPPEPGRPFGRRPPARS